MRETIAILVAGFLYSSISHARCPEWLAGAAQAEAQVRLEPSIELQLILLSREGTKTQQEVAKKYLNFVSGESLAPGHKTVLRILRSGSFRARLGLKHVLALAEKIYATLDSTRSGAMAEAFRRYGLLREFRAACPVGA